MRLREERKAHMSIIASGQTNFRALQLVKTDFTYYIQRRFFQIQILFDIPQSQHKITIVNINELQIQYVKEILMNKRSEFHGTARFRE